MMDPQRQRKLLKTEHGTRQPTEESMPDYSDRLPEEMLEIIFSHIREPEDVQSLSKTLPKFSRIVGPSKRTVLFGEVFPKIFSELDNSDILNCRLVCQDWKKGVDKHLQTQPRTRLKEPYKSDESSSPTVPIYAPKFNYNLVRKGFLSLQLHEIIKITNFMNYARHHGPGNPFVLRSVSFDDCQYGDFDKDVYWASVFSLLTSYGQHIWHLYIHVSKDQARQHGRYCHKMLQRCLGYLPMLRTMAISGFNGGPEVHPSRQLGRSLELEEYIERNPLPDLPFLEVMDVELMHTPETRVVSDELMRRYMPRAKIIASRLSLWNLCKFIPIVRLITIQLTSLEVYVDMTVHKWNIFCSQLDAPNLAKINLIVQRRIRMDSLLKSLVHLKSLQYLALRIIEKPKDFSLEGMYVPEFTLDQVRTLEIVDGPHVPFGMLLSHLPKLEYMLVSGDFWPEEGKSFTIMSGCHYNFQVWAIMQSKTSGKNVWEIFKSLKEVTLAWLDTNTSTTLEVLEMMPFTRDMVRELPPLQEEEEDESEEEKLYKI